MTIVKEASYFKTAFYGTQIHVNYQRKRENSTMHGNVQEMDVWP